MASGPPARGEGCPPRPVTCVQHILAAGIPRVVFGWREPPIFTEGRGAEQLRAAGITVVEIPELARAASAINARALRNHGVQP